ncbi:MAG: molybdopterin synthase sulfur carrier subunit [Chloroflexi bacterium]|jgi:adenylyltransferase/sulfurtransferase|nr:molybdopterin synthase sulfur carrier subunit [Chloroflexota bacterium]|tara:strand:+ start:95 stop:379 length:285 start_codon:yes stop_codon:yes gene_type:complete
MANDVLIPTPLRVYADKQELVQAEGNTVGELLEDLTVKYSDLKKHLYNEDGRLRSFVNIYLNDDDIRYLDREATIVKDGDTISIVPSVAGGGDE